MDSCVVKPGRKCPRGLAVDAEVSVRQKILEKSLDLCISNGHNVSTFRWLCGFSTNSNFYPNLKNNEIEEFFCCELLRK